ncbi:substrate-binding domain-containing protein [Enterococcus italicus]|uniref:substrate-binding domain-containing protein n=1 Tax=Enterococcus italicus TaxID=246144 RepID=UPI003F45D4B8
MLVNHYKVPQQIAIISFDSTEFNELAQPKITSVATDLEFMADSALKLMENRIQFPSKPYTQIAIQPMLMIRQST